MKLLLIQNMLYVPSLGGANTTTRLLLEGLAQAGHTCRMIVLALGSAIKGIDIFLALARRLPLVSFAAVPTWATTDSDRAALDALPNVTLLDPVDDIDEIFARTRVLLVPSMCNEAFGNIVVEAMLHGIPVLASDVGGLPESKLGVDYVLPVRPFVRYAEQFDERNCPVAVIPRQDIGPWAEALGRPSLRPATL